MPTYQVQWRYKSGLGGPWEKGEIVELEEWRANHINVDSPGVLKPVDSGQLTVNSKKTGKTSKGGKNRMVTKAQNRKFVMGADQEGYGKELARDKESD